MADSFLKYINHLFCLYFFNIYLLLFTYLADPSLGCGIWDLIP